MSPLRLISITLTSLATHAFRSILAALGVVLGVAAVIGMTAISEGARREALAQIEAQGIDTIVVRSVKPSAAESAAGGDGMSLVNAYGITDSDRRHIENSFENVRRVIPVRDMMQSVHADGGLTDIGVMATTPDFFALMGVASADNRGRFLRPMDGDRLKTVCVLGRSAARKLFAFRDPLGQSVTLGEISFRVIGVLDNIRGARLGGAHDLDNLVFVPLNTANALFGKRLMQVLSRRSIEQTQVEISYLHIVVRDVEQSNNTAARLRTYLGTTHDKLDYEIHVPYELLRQKEATQRIFTIVMASIAAISLVVGGIGIMNIMLANIYERTREIGTRRALGAKRRDILVQFLAESVALTGLGGAIGLALGAGIAAVVQRYAQMPTDITSSSVVLALSVSILTGIVFGTYPAWKAAQLDPIVALRHE